MRTVNFSNIIFKYHTVRKIYILHHHLLTFAFHAGMVWLRTSKPGDCSRLQSNLTRYLLLNALPYTKLNENIMGAFSVPSVWSPVSLHLYWPHSNGVFCMSLAQMLIRRHRQHWHQACSNRAFVIFISLLAVFMVISNNLYIFTLYLNISKQFIVI